MKKRIIIVSAVFPPEQVTSALMNYDLAVELAKKYDVTVIRPFPTRPLGVKYESAEINSTSFKTVLLKTYTCPQSSLRGRFRESVSFGKKSAQYIRHHHNEIDFVYNSCWHLFGMGIVAFTAKRFGIPYMVPIQDIYPESLLTGHHYPSIVQKGILFLLKPIDKYYQKRSYRIRTISDEMALYLSKTRKIPIDRYLIVNNWQNDEDFTSSIDAKKKGQLRFAYVGSINLHSNTDLIIRAFKKAQLHNAELRIYGGGDKKEQCEKLAKELGMTNVSFDMVSRDLVPSVQGESDILLLALPKGNSVFCLPSKITSYMLSGRPILASVDLNSATCRYIKDADCGVVVGPDDEDALVNGFKSMSILGKKMLSEMGKNARCYADEHLTKKVNLKIVVDSIDGCLE